MAERQEVTPEEYAAVLAGCGVRVVHEDGRSRYEFAPDVPAGERVGSEDA